MMLGDVSQVAHDYSPGKGPTSATICCTKISDALLDSINYEIRLGQSLRDTNLISDSDLKDYRKRLFDDERAIGLLVEI